MNDNIGKYFVYNGCIYDVNCINIIPSKIGELKTGDLYEVLRAIDGKLLFFKDHIDRLRKSITISGFNYTINEYELKNDLIKLLDANDYKTCNIKIVLSYNENTFYLYAYLSKFKYPKVEDYINGVDVDFFEIERTNPNAKVINVDYKKKVQDVISSKNLFEVLLVNKNGIVTEGSRTNVFFIFGNEVYTAPSDFVLKGITRKYALKACEDINIKVIEKEISKEEALKADGIFLSGTSIKVLPVKSINDTAYNTGSNNNYKKILDSFNKIVDNSLVR